METEQLVAWIAAVTLAVTILGYLASMKHDLGRSIGGVATGLSGKIDKLDRKVDHVREEFRSELNDGLGRIDARLTVIEQRTYDLSTRLPPAPAARST